MCRYGRTSNFLERRQRSPAFRPDGFTNWVLPASEGQQPPQPMGDVDGHLATSILAKSMGYHDHRWGHRCCDCGLNFDVAPDDWPVNGHVTATHAPYDWPFYVNATRNSQQYIGIPCTSGIIR